MGNGSLKTTKGKNVMLYRTYTENASLSSTEYLAPTKFKIGVNNVTPTIAATDLTYPIPISAGVVNDNGDNTFTGSNGGTNTTDNTTYFKQGAGVSDNTAQNLLTTGSNVLKTWTISNLATLGTVIDANKYGGHWLYIKDSTILDTIVSVVLKLGSDTSNYYSLTFLNAALTTGWNWITSSDIISAWTETGTVSGTIDTFIIADAFITDDVVYDLLRTWTVTDTLKNFVVGFPDLDFITNEATTRGLLTSLEANGYLINAFASFNEDTTPIMDSIDAYDEESKSANDEIAFVAVDRVI